METILTPKQAAAILSMHTETLRRWETEGRIQSQRTPGGHRRYREIAVLELKQEIESGKHLEQINRADTVPFSKSKIRQLKEGLDKQTPKTSNSEEFTKVQDEQFLPPSRPNQHSLYDYQQLHEREESKFGYHSRLFLCLLAIAGQAIVCLLIKTSIESPNSAVGTGTWWPMGPTLLTLFMLMSILSFAVFSGIQGIQERFDKTLTAIALRLAAGIMVIIAIVLLTAAANKASDIMKQNKAEIRQAMQTYLAGGNAAGSCIRSQAKMEIAGPQFIGEAEEAAQTVKRKELPALIVKYKEQLEAKAKTFDQEC